MFWCLQTVFTQCQGFIFFSLCSLPIKHDWVKGWQETQLGEITQTGQRDIWYRIISSLQRVVVRTFWISRRPLLGDWLDVGLISFVPLVWCLSPSLFPFPFTYLIFISNNEFSHLFICFFPDPPKGEEKSNWLWRNSTTGWHPPITTTLLSHTSFVIYIMLCSWWLRNFIWTNLNKF